MLITANPKWSPHLLPGIVLKAFYGLTHGNLHNSPKNLGEWERIPILQMRIRITGIKRPEK
jgi:hypothetical protein